MRADCSKVAGYYVVRQTCGARYALNLFASPVIEVVTSTEFIIYVIIMENNRPTEEAPNSKEIRSEFRTSVV